MVLRYLILSFLVLILPTHVSADKWKTYENPQVHLKIDHPSDWHIERDLWDKVISADRTAILSVIYTFVTSDLDVRLRTNDNALLEESKIELTHSAVQDLKFLGTKKIVLTGRSFRILAYTYSKDSTEGKDYILREGPIVYVFRFTASIKKFKEYELTVEHMIETFKPMPPEVVNQARAEQRGQ